MIITVEMVDMERSLFLSFSSSFILIIFVFHGRQSLRLGVYMSRWCQMCCISDPRQGGGRGRGGRYARVEVGKGMGAARLEVEQGQATRADKDQG